MTLKVNDFTNFDYYSNIPPRPGKDVIYPDPFTELPIVRITDSPTQYPPSSEAVYPYASPGYLLWDGVNCDSTFIHLDTLTSDGLRIIHQFQPPFEEVARFPVEVGSSPIEQRWSKTDPDIAYFVHDGCMKQFRVSTQEVSIVRDFKPDWPGATSITWSDKGDSDVSGQYWAFLVRNPDTAWEDGYFVYDLFADQVVSSLNQADMRNIPALMSSQYLSMSTMGGWVWWASLHLCAQREGFADFKHLETSGHGEPGMTAEGVEVLVYVGMRYQGATPLGLWVYMRDFATRSVTWLCPYPGAGSFHVSCNYPGWCVVNDYGPRERPGSADYDENGDLILPRVWSSNGLFLVELTNRTDQPPRMIRLCNTMTKHETYGTVQFGKQTIDGSAIYWGSNWRDSILGHLDDLNIPYQYDAYKIVMPADWQNTPSVAPVAHPYPDLWLPNQTEPWTDYGTAIMPDLIGLTPAESNAAIALAGFRVGSYVTQESSEPAGTIVEQWPEAGGEYEKRSYIMTARSTGEATEPEPIVTLSIDPTEILQGEMATLNWVTEYADSVSISPDIGPVDLSGTFSVTPSETTTYILTATGPGGTITENVSITVIVDPLVLLEALVASLEAAVASLEVGLATHTHELPEHDHPGLESRLSILEIFFNRIQTLLAAFNNLIA